MRLVSSAIVLLNSLATRLAGADGVTLLRAASVLLDVWEISEQQLWRLTLAGGDALQRTVERFGPLRGTALSHIALPQRPSQTLDLRVAKALGSKGYRKVRVSAVTPEAGGLSDFDFSYRSQFRYRWTQNYLHSTVLELQDGPQELAIGGKKVVLKLPPEDAGIRGVFWSDPCFSSKYVACIYAEAFKMFPRSHGMLNAIFADDSMDLFGMLGDNFYDRSGALSQEFFQQVSDDVKRRFWIVANGNHDNWVCGFPSCGSEADNFGYGQMQFYAQDSIASRSGLLENASFLDFDIDPDRRRQWNTFQNNATNFFLYHKFGNLGFLAYTGAGTFHETLPYLREACDFFAEAKPAMVFLLGHWNEAGMGCAENMSVPRMREELLKLPACAAFGDRLKYLDGHEHCNYVQARGETEPYGFMIGAHGMAESSCMPHYGFVFLDSTGGRVRLHYFEVASGGVWGLVIGGSLAALLGCVLGGLFGSWARKTRAYRCPRCCSDRCCSRCVPICGFVGALLGGCLGAAAGLVWLTGYLLNKDNYQTILDCLSKSGGLSACTHLADLWLDEPVDNFVQQWV